MSTMPATLFRLGPGLRGVVLVVAVLTLAAFVGLPPEEDALGSTMRFACELALVLLALAMLAPRRCHWAGRLLCFLVVAGYVAGAASGLAEQGSTEDWVTLLLGLAFIAGPALAYALRPARSRRPYRLHFATIERRLRAGADADARRLEQLAEWLAPRLALEGWGVGPPHDDDGDRVQVVERDGVRTILGTSLDAIEPEPSAPDRELVWWHLWLWRDEPVDWREEPLAHAVEQACQVFGESPERAA